MKIKTKTSNDKNSSPYVLIAQANLRNQIQAAAELTIYLNQAMKNYRLGDNNNDLKTSKEPLSKRQRKRRRQTDQQYTETESNKKR